MASHHEIIDFIENIRAEIPAHLHGFYEEAVDRALEQQQRRGKEFARQIIDRSPMIRREFEHQQQEEGILAIFVLLIGFLGGAALMYLFDPDRGEQRRASLLGQVNRAEEQVKSQANAVAHQASETVKEVQGQANKAVKDATTQANKTASSASDSVKEAAGQVSGAANDAALMARVRAEVARDVRNSLAIDVMVNQGVVTLKGQIPASEAKGLVEKVQAIQGVKSVDNRLEIHDAAPTSSGTSSPSSTGTGTSTSGSNNVPR